MDDRVPQMKVPRAAIWWAIADHLRAELVVDALEMAVARRRPDAGLVHHSDQGSQSGLKPVLATVCP
jgi:transposase InsO family protein